MQQQQQQAYSIAFASHVAYQIRSKTERKRRTVCGKVRGGAVYRCTVVPLYRRNGRARKAVKGEK